jgi:hypothetical protein
VKSSERKRNERKPLITPGKHTEEKLLKTEISVSVKPSEQPN